MIPHETNHGTKEWAQGRSSQQSTLDIATVISKRT